MAEGVANIAAGAIETLASLFGGGSPAPAPKQEQHEQQEPRQPEPPPIRQLDTGGRKPQTMEEFLAIERREQQDRAARLQEIARSLGASEAMTPEELQREEQAKRSRDRGGGISR